MKPYEEFVQEIRQSYACLEKTLANENHSEQEALDTFKGIVSVCVPSVVELMANKNWRKLWNKYNQRLQDLLSRPYIRNRSFYFIDFLSILCDARQSKAEMIQTYNLFEAFENTVQELFDIIHSNRNLEMKFQHKLEAKIVEVVTAGPSLADESNNSSFKNFVNEIAFFYHIAKHLQIGLVDIEKNLPNGKSVDFHLVWDNSEYFVDTITIQNTLNQEELNRFIEGKINDKFFQKTQNLQDKYILDKFRVQAIIEFEDNRLLDYSPNLPNDKCFPPMISLMERTDEKGWVITLEQLPLKDDVKNKLINNK